MFINHAFILISGHDGYCPSLLPHVIIISGFHFRFFKVNHFFRKILNAKCIDPKELTENLHSVNPVQNLLYNCQKY